MLPDPDELDVEDPAASFDDDLVALHASGTHLFDGLDPLERQVVAGRFGFDGRPHTFRELSAETGLPQSQVRRALGHGLAKMRTRLV